MKMISKKAQGEIITTVLIILLVLAAIVIVWQVVNGTVNRGGDAVTAQSSCLGLSIDITVNSSKAVAIRPNKDIAGFRIYKNGVQNITADSYILSAFTTFSNSTVYAGNDTITTAGKIGTQWCDGMNSEIVP